MLTNTDAGHCQICGRLIKAKNGRIAHHGYTRPNQGWQTRSCYGARFRPYEEACNAIEGYIKELEVFVGNQKVHLSNLQHSPPEKITFYREFRDRPYGKPETVERPADFDPDRDVGVYATRYDTEYKRIVRRTKENIVSAGETIEYLRKRLADWRPAQAA